MADDREILREVWDGRIPVCFQLSPEEVTTVVVPDPVHLMVSRLTYFPLIMDKVRKHFANSIVPDKQESEVWIDYDGQPVKWHYPVGLLFDLIKPSVLLPWTLTVHFDKFPEQEVIHCNCREAVESLFISMIKEADTLKHRAQIISNMLKKEHNQLWNGLLNDKFDQFWAVNKKLMESTDDGFKYIPFRIYINGEMPCIQKLVKPYSEDKRSLILKDLLETVIPDFQGSEQVIVHGVDVPLELPLQWMSEHLSYPDNFLHICVHHT